MCHSLGISHENIHNQPLKASILEALKNLVLEQAIKKYF